VVGLGEGDRAVGDEDHQVGLGHGELHLVAHADHDGVLGVVLEAAGVDEDVGPPAHLGVGVVPVAGDAGLVLHDGQVLAREAVEEGALAHVGATHDGHQRARLPRATRTSAGGSVARSSRLTRRSPSAFARTRGA
jgi:hypothetical protein